MKRVGNHYEAGDARGNQWDEICYCDHCQGDNEALDPRFHCAWCKAPVGLYDVGLITSVRLKESFEREAAEGYFTFVHLDELGRLVPIAIAGEANPDCSGRLIFGRMFA